MDIRCPCVTSKLDLFKGEGGVWWLVARGEGRGREGKREEERGRKRNWVDRVSRWIMACRAISFARIS